MQNTTDKFIKFLLTTILLLCLGCAKQDTTSEKQARELRIQVDSWCDAVENEQVGKALMLSTEICGDIPSPHLSTQIAELCRNNGISPQFLTANFNSWDYQHWKHALFFKKLAKKVTDEIQESENIVPELFSAVRERIESVEPPKSNILWPYTIWHLKKGVCDRQAWVLCELAYQLGYETQIVYLRDPETLVSPHTICELRKGTEVWFADPYFAKLLPNTSVADLAADPKLAAATWPDKKDLQEAIKKSAYWLPAYPQDYRPRNQVLQSKIKALLDKDCPRFGESPVYRLEKYKSFAAEKDKRFPYGLWFYPFRLLYAEMEKLKGQ